MLINYLQKEFLQLQSPLCPLESSGTPSSPFFSELGSFDTVKGEILHPVFERLRIVQARPGSWSTLATFQVTFPCQTLPPRGIARNPRSDRYHMRDKYLWYGQLCQSTVTRQPWKLTRGRVNADEFKLYWRTSSLSPRLVTFERLLKSTTQLEVVLSVPDDRVVSDTGPNQRRDPSSERDRLHQAHPFEQSPRVQDLQSGLSFSCAPHGCHSCRPCHV